MPDAFPDDFDAAREVPSGPPPLNRIPALAAASLGIALFCVTALFILPLEGLIAEIAFVYTPLFGVPLAVGLWRQKQIRWLGALYFIVGLTAAHYAAVRLADGIYAQGVNYAGECTNLAMGPLNADAREQKTCEEHAAAIRAHNAPRAGLAGGLIGAALSFVGLALLGRRFRAPRKIAVMAGATLVLGAIGAAGMSFVFPDRMRAAAWVTQIFLPWQIVFALALLALFDDRLIGRKASARD